MTIALQSAQAAISGWTAGLIQGAIQMAALAGDHPVVSFELVCGASMAMALRIGSVR